MPEVNSQVLSSITATSKAVMDPLPTLPVAIVKAQVTQAMGLAIADASDYVRNITSLSTAVTGVALRKMLEDMAQVPQASAALLAATEAVQSATKNLQSMGESAKAVLEAWPDDS
jgi:hypothetical protein